MNLIKSNKNGNKLNSKVRQCVELEMIDFMAQSM